VSRDNKAIRWIDLLDRSKTAPSELFAFLDRCPPAKAAVQTSIDRALTRLPDWPAELRNWQPILLALLRVEVATIEDPWHRAAFDKQILEKSRAWGFSPTLVQMVGSQVFPLYERLKDDMIPGVVESDLYTEANE
jgi:hypothetical protein